MSDSRVAGRARGGSRRDGAADRRDTDVAGESESPGMGEPLAIAQQEVGRVRELRERREDRRPFAEREESGHVRHLDRALVARNLDHPAAGPLEDDDRGVQPATRAVVRQVRPGDALGRRGQRHLADAAGQTALEVGGAGKRRWKEPLGGARIGTHRRRWRWAPADRPAGTRGNRVMYRTCCATFRALFRSPALGLLVAALVAGAGSGCRIDDDSRTLATTANRWFVALHERDFQELARVDASAPPDREGDVFETWKRQVTGVLVRHEIDRDRGVLEPDPQGYRLVLATQLGHGAFWEEVGREDDEEGPALRIRINFGYGEVNYLPLPPGTTIYLLGWPLGTIYPIRLGEGRTHEMEVLEHLECVVHFRRVEPLVPGDAVYKVSRLEWLPETAVHRSVSWVF